MHSTTRAILSFLGMISFGFGVLLVVLGIRGASTGAPRDWQLGVIGLGFLIAGVILVSAAGRLGRVR